MWNAVAVLIAAYLFGSVPTALILSHMMGRGDIRLLGDGNMGARNVTHVLGWGAGAIVAGVDFSKGAIAVAVARQLDSVASLQLAAGIAAVLGHDFPVWAGFRGGQGMATSLGVLSMLMPESTLWGMAAFGATYLVIRNFDLSAGVGLALLVFLAWRADEPLAWVGYAALLFVSIPLKKWLDLPRRRALIDLEEQKRG
jgi:glycerol-3-phosphate acyltransferase PlsY